ncbi:MAG: YfhO family protein [Bacteroidota bacterium]|nr:YfhO family protein [Bacteroidota bacterium]
MSSKTKHQQKAQIGYKASWFDSLSSMKKDTLCVFILLLLVYILFFRIITSDMIFSDSGDTAAAHSWGKSFEKLKEQEQTPPHWIPYIFSGIPIAAALMFPHNPNYLEIIVQFPARVIFLNAEMSWMVLHFFLMGVFMLLLARQMKFSHLPSLLAGLTFMLNPYAIGLAQGGHGTKLMTLTFIPLVFMLTYALFQRKDILTIGLLAAALGTMFLNKHPQIAFYGLLFIGSYVLYEIVITIRKEPSLVIKKILFLALALGIGFAIYSYEFLPTQEYSAYSIRGAGSGGEGATSGLSYDYATNWSFHPFELMNYFIPSFFGFSSPFYWGWMPFTESTVYIGIVPILLSIVALVYRRTKLTWFLIIFSIIMFFISFGKHFGILYNLFFDYMPYFNKFRVPVMILHLIPITFGILAAIGLTVLADMQSSAKLFNLEKLRKRLYITVGIIGAILLIGFISNDSVYSAVSGTMFQRSDDMQQLKQQYGGQAQQVLEQLKRMRFDLLWKDYIKFALISGVSIGFIIMYIKRKMNFTTLTLGFLVVLIIDLFILDMKFIDPKPRSLFEERFHPDATVKFFKTDTTLFRVFPIGQDLFQDNTYMYHQVASIGGYSPAKLKIYQELLESSLYSGSDPQFPLNMNVVNMLNAKYLVAQGKLPEERFTLVYADQAKGIATFLNPDHLPRAWFVDTAIIAHSKTETFSYMNLPSWNPRVTAILEKSPITKFTKSVSANVVIAKHESGKIVLSTFSSNTSLLVLSEVYYPAGWKAFVDGQETEIYKTNYVLRSIVVPAGSHNVEFRFQSSTYEMGLNITNGAWIITAILIIIGMIQIPSVRQKLPFRKIVT